MKHVSLRSGRLIAQPNERLFVWNHSQKLWINKVDEWKPSVSCCSAQFNLVFRSCSGHKVIYKSQSIIQTGTRGGFLCVCTADIHLSVSGWPEAKVAARGWKRTNRIHFENTRTYLSTKPNSPVVLKLIQTLLLLIGRVIIYIQCSLSYFRFESLSDSEVSVSFDQFLKENIDVHVLMAEGRVSTLSVVC